LQVGWITELKRERDDDERNEKHRE
jgi:hypothetical protein